MNPTESTSKSNETLPTATDPSTAVTLEEAKEIARIQHEAIFVRMMGEIEGKKEAARVWETMWAEDEEEEEDEEEGGCVYCHDEEIYAHCDECEVRATGDGGAMCRVCFYEHGHEEYEPHQRWCGGCWRERCEKRGEEEEEGCAVCGDARVFTRTGGANKTMTMCQSCDEFVAGRLALR